MKQNSWIVTVLLLSILSSGCAVPGDNRFLASNKSVSYQADHAAENTQISAVQPDDTKTPDDGDMTDPTRLYVKVGSVCLQVPLLGKTKLDIRDRLKQNGGYIEVLQNARMVLRVPAAKFQPMLDSLKQVGRIVEQDIRIVDVTDSYHDIEAELKNLIAMRDRFKAMLEKAQTVKDALAIETELNRIQIRIDQLTARQAEMKKKITYAKLTIRLQETTGQSESGRLRPAYWLNQIGLNRLFAR